MKNFITLFLTFFFVTISNAQIEKATINTARSNTKGLSEKPKESLEEKQITDTNPLFEEKNSSKKMISDEQKPNNNTSRSNKKKVTEIPADSLSNASKSKKGKFKAGTELSDKVR